MTCLPDRRVQEQTGAVTRAIDIALGLIAQDLVMAEVPLPRIELIAWLDLQPSESVMLFTPDGCGVGVWLDLRLPQADGLAHLADQVQDWAVEELARLGRPTNWPACAAHPASHPRQATVEGGRAVWACPVGGAVSSPIGEISRS